MTDDPDRDAGSDQPSAYAPKRMRGTAGAKLTPGAADAVIQGAAGHDLGGSETDRERHGRSVRSAAATDPARRRGNLVIDDFRVPRSLEPEVLPNPWPGRPLRPSALGILVRWVAAGSVGALVALFVVEKFSWPWPALSSSGPLAFLSVPGSRIHATTPDDRSGEPTATVERSRPAALQLMVAQALPHAVDEAVPLGASVRAAPAGAVVMVAGLPIGSALSAGRQWAVDRWRLEPAELENVAVRPPPGFTGAMDLVLELRLADDTIADRQFLRLEWIGATRAAGAGDPAGPMAGSAATSAPSPPPAVDTAAVKPPAAPVRQIDRAEINALLARGDELMSQGDIAAARLVLQRAADAQDARAALALGATYDPIVLEKLGVRGLAADVAKARAWYEKAKQFGSSEAPRRIEMLASRDH